MARLKDRNRQIPNGLKFAIPQLKFQSSGFTTFNSLCNTVYNLVRSNVDKAEANGWPVHYEGVCEWVDTYNAEICKANGWVEFYVDTDAPVAINRIQKAEWPLWAKAIGLMRGAGDTGVGDTVERMIGADNSEAFKTWYKATFGKPCNCNGRKADWNVKYHYD